MTSYIRGNDNFDSDTGFSDLYSLRAWITATNGNTINGSGGISSVADEGVGRYQANMSNAVTSAHGMVCGSRIFGYVNEDRQGVSVGAVGTTYYEFGGGHNQGNGAYEDGTYSAGLTH